MEHEAFLVDLPFKVVIVRTYVVMFVYQRVIFKMVKVLIFELSMDHPAPETPFNSPGPFVLSILFCQEVIGTCNCQDIWIPRSSILHH